MPYGYRRVSSRWLMLHMTSWRPIGKRETFSSCTGCIWRGGESGQEGGAGWLGVGCQYLVEPVQSTQKHHQNRWMLVPFVIFKYPKMQLVQNMRKKGIFINIFTSGDSFTVYSYIRSKLRGTCTASAIRIRVNYVDRDFSPLNCRFLFELTGR